MKIRAIPIKNITCWLYVLRYSQ